MINKIQYLLKLINNLLKMNKIISSIETKLIFNNLIPIKIDNNHYKFLIKNQKLEIFKNNK